ncbi:FecCD family ABC transporter permease [Paenibacillus cucumis (ex Kampfer et al. 2016)]|uniref:Iron ABC transporter permease n=1 Tax=Paenibacillus cucumis (ex Kampfer et al. 2016) TaxID=1776858 RepID=A0ABS7KDY1_9BACL|nr:iron ABC transporter permease [Paenibacillus cucumis (ex Kampfer et al. 2016)]MBY0202358.1 iron ABC transporter permease [Paenibacillus cucumis (ex Kampfer et al. 2016)]
MTRLKNPSSRSKWSFAALMTAVLFLIALVFILSLRFGATPVTFREIIDQFQAQSGTIYELRLPRVLCAMLVGIAASVAGAILQTVLRNPLASPDVIGATAGGGLVTVVIILLAPLTPAIWLPFYSMAGSATASLIIFLLAYRRQGTSMIRLALVGIAVSSALQAIIKMLIVKYAMSSSQALVWLKGSLYARSLQHVEMLWPWTAAGLLAAMLLVRYLNVLKLDESVLVSLGTRVRMVRTVLLIVALALSASSASISGNLSFVGLIIPHLSHKLVGENFIRSLPFTAALGALLVMLGDMIGRILIPPMEIPVGIITSLIGAPYFVYLIIKQGQKK